MVAECTGTGLLFICKLTSVEVRGQVVVWFSLVSEPSLSLFDVMENRTRTLNFCPEKPNKAFEIFKYLVCAPEKFVSSLMSE